MHAHQRESSHPWRQIIRRVIEEVAARTPESKLPLPLDADKGRPDFQPFSFEMQVEGRTVVARLNPSAPSFISVDNRAFPFGLVLGDLRRAAQTLQLAIFGISVTQDPVPEFVDYVVESLIAEGGRVRAQYLATIGAQYALDPAQLTHEERIDLFRDAPAHRFVIPLRTVDRGFDQYELHAEIALDHERPSKLCLCYMSSDKRVGAEVPFPYYWGMATNAAGRIAEQLKQLTKQPGNFETALS